MRSKSEIAFLSTLGVILWILLLATGVLCALGLSTVENRSDEIACAVIGIAGSALIAGAVIKEKLLSPLN